MGAVRRTQHPVHLPAGAAVPLTFVPVVEMLHLHLAAEAYKYGYTVCSRKGGPSGEGKGCGENFSRTQKQSGTEQEHRGEVWTADKAPRRCPSLAHGLKITL